jgi:acid ceramidase
MFALVTLLTVGVSAAGDPATCNMDNVSYPPALDPLPSGLEKNLSWVTVDLDKAPQDRWTDIVQPLAQDIGNMAEVIEHTLRLLLGNSTVTNLLAKIDAKLPDLYAKMPKDYGAEIAGIATATGIEPSIMWIYNFAYTLFGACTSIVTQAGPDGEVFHARNLDFGLWPAFELKNGNVWKLTAALRPLLVNVRFMRDGKELYKSTAFAGFIGALTASKQGAFSLSVDTRYDAHVDAGLLKWIFSASDDDTELTFLTRMVFEDETDYKGALDTLVNTKIIGPAYIIVSGVEQGEGAVITKGAGGLLEPDGLTINSWELQSEIAGNNSYALVQTNYDNWKNAPKFDNRRDPAKQCVKQLEPEQLDFNGLYNILNAKPNLNDLTTYTTLMHAKSGRFESYRQLCTGKGCPLF